MSSNAGTNDYKELPPIPHEDDDRPAEPLPTFMHFPSTPRQSLILEQVQTSPGSIRSSSASGSASASPNRRAFLRGILGASVVGSERTLQSPSSFGERIRHYPPTEMKRSVSSTSSVSRASTMFSRFRSQPEPADPKLRPFLLPQYSTEHKTPAELKSPQQVPRSSTPQTGPQRYMPFAPRPGAFDSARVPVLEGKRCPKCNSNITLNPILKPNGMPNVIGWEEFCEIIKFPKFVNGERELLDMVWSCRINKHPWPYPEEVVIRPGSHDGEDEWEQKHGLVSETRKGVDKWIEKVRGQMTRGEIMGDPALLPKKREPGSGRNTRSDVMSGQWRERDIVMSFEVPHGPADGKGVQGNETHYGGIFYDSNSDKSGSMKSPKVGIIDRESFGREHEFSAVAPLKEASFSVRSPEKQKHLLLEAEKEGIKPIVTSYVDSIGSATTTQFSNKENQGEHGKHDSKMAAAIEQLENDFGISKQRCSSAKRNRSLRTSPNDVKNSMAEVGSLASSTQSDVSECPAALQPQLRSNTSSNVGFHVLGEGQTTNTSVPQLALPLFGTLALSVTTESPPLKVANDQGGIITKVDEVEIDRSSNYTTDRSGSGASGNDEIGKDDASESSSSAHFYDRVRDGHKFLQ